MRATGLMGGDVDGPMDHARGATGASVFGPPKRAQRPRRQPKVAGSAL
jgi:hypothetical protein